MTGRPLYKRPESVLVLVYTLAGRVLLLRRRQPADFWQSVTGSLEWEESDPLGTAYRELREETGLQGVVIEDCGIINRFPILPAWRSRYQPGVRDNTEYVFKTILPECLPIRLNPEEHGEYAWLERDAAATRVSSYTNRDAILRWVPGAP
jgi:dATP pyrophosphohydrolase